MTKETATRAVPVTRGRFKLFSCHIYKGLMKAKGEELEEMDGRSTEARELEARIVNASEKMADLMITTLDDEPQPSDDLDYFVVHGFKALVTDKADRLLKHENPDPELVRRLLRIAIRTSRQMVARAQKYEAA